MCLGTAHSVAEQRRAAGRQLRLLWVRAPTR